VNEVDLEKLKLEYLKKMWARMSYDEDERNCFQSILDIYFDRVEDRELNI